MSHKKIRSVRWVKIIRRYNWKCNATYLKDLVHVIKLFIDVAVVEKTKLYRLKPMKIVLLLSLNKRFFPVIDLICLSFVWRPPFSLQALIPKS